MVFLFHRSNFVSTLQIQNKYFIHFCSYDAVFLSQVRRTRSFENSLSSSVTNTLTVRFQVSISSTLYTHIFCTKVLCTAFLKLHFGKRSTFIQKPSRKMWMKLTQSLHPAYIIDCLQLAREACVEYCILFKILPLS